MQPNAIPGQLATPERRNATQPPSRWNSRTPPVVPAARVVCRTRLVEEHRRNEDRDGEHDHPLPDFLLVLGRDELERDVPVAVNDIAEERI